MRATGAIRAAIRAAMRAAMTVLGVALLALAAGRARAEDAGAVHVHGELALTAAGRGDARDWNWDAPGTSAFDAYVAHLQAEDRLNAHWEVDGHAWYRQEVGLELLGAYVQYTPAPARDFHVLAGKIPWLIGSEADRAYPDKNPLVGVPMLYQFHTGLTWYALPTGASSVVSTSAYGDGFSGSKYYAGGMPVVWESWWDVGIMAVGSARPFEGAFGVTQGTPGWGEPYEDGNAGKTVLGRIGLTPVPAVRVGLSGAMGPYLDDALADSLPPGKSIGDYDQQLLMTDAEFQLGHVEARGEAYRNVWQTPRTGDLRVSGYYVEGKYTLPVGLYAAARWENQRFSKVDGGAGAGVPWHADEDRFEGGLGYRVSRDVIAKAVYQRQRSLAGGPSQPGDSAGLAAVSLVVKF